MKYDLCKINKKKGCPKKVLFKCSFRKVPLFLGHHVDDIMNQVSEEYGDLEKLSEGELMEILKSLEADEEDEENSLEEVKNNFII